MPHRCTNCTETFPDGSKEMLSGCPHCGGNTFQYLPEDRLDDPPDESPPERPDAPGIDSSMTETVGRAATTVRQYVSRRQSPPADGPRTADTDGGERDTDIRTPSPADGPGPTDEPTPSPQESRTDPDEHPTDPQTETTPESGSVDRISTAGDVGSSSDGSAGATHPDEDVEVSRDPKDTEDTAQASARGEIADLSELRAADSAADADEEPPTAEGRVVDRPDEDIERPDLQELREELNDQFESIKILEPGQYELNLMELYDREEHIIALQEDGKYVIEVPDSWRDERQPDGED